MRFDFPLFSCVSLLFLTGILSAQNPRHALVIGAGTTDFRTQDGGIERVSSSNNSSSSGSSSFGRSGRIDSESYLLHVGYTYEFTPNWEVEVDMSYTSRRGNEYPSAQAPPRNTLDWENPEERSYQHFSNSLVIYYGRAPLRDIGLKIRAGVGLAYGAFWQRYVSEYVYFSDDVLDHKRIVEQQGSDFGVSYHLRTSLPIEDKWLIGGKVSYANFGEGFGNSGWLLFVGRRF